MEIFKCSKSFGELKVELFDFFYDILFPQFTAKCNVVEKSPYFYIKIWVRSDGWCVVIKKYLNKKKSYVNLNKSSSHFVLVNASCISFSLLIQIDLFCVKKQMPKPPPINFFFSKTFFIFRSRQNMLNFQMLLKRIQAFFFSSFNHASVHFKSCDVLLSANKVNFDLTKKKPSVNIIIFFSIKTNKNNKHVFSTISFISQTYPCFTL